MWAFVISIENAKDNLKIKSPYDENLFKKKTTFETFAWCTFPLQKNTNCLHSDVGFLAACAKLTKLETKENKIESH